MDSVVLSALDEICCGAANGINIRNFWPKLNPYLASQGLPLCPKVKQAVWDNLLEIPGLKLEPNGGGGGDPCSPTKDLSKCTIEECEKMNVKIVAPESTRKSFLGIYEMEASESGLSDDQRLILERLSMARTNGIPQSVLSKELGKAPNHLFYPLKSLEIKGLIVRQPTVIRTKQASYSNDSIVSTNMIYLYRYGKHLGSQQRIEITKEEKPLTNGDTDDHTKTDKGFDDEIFKDDVQVKDFLPALKAICEKLEKAQGKVLVVSDIKHDLGYRGVSGHRAWRIISHKLKDAQVVEECCTMINNKEVNCLRLLQSFSLSHFESKFCGHGDDDIDTEQSKILLNRGQITEQLVELSILRQVYEMVDAAGSKGLTNKEVCRRLGLCSKEYHRRYFKQMISRFGLHLQLENLNRNEVYRLWTPANFNRKSLTPDEGETVLKEANESDPHVVDLDFQKDISQSVQAIDTSTSTEKVRCINKNRNDAAIIEEASNGTNMDNESSSSPLLQGNQQSYDVKLYSGVPDEEVSHANNSAENDNQLEKCSLAVEIPTPSTSRRQSNLRYPRLTVGATSAYREQHILKILEEEKFLVKADLHKRIEDFENLEKGKTTMMDRKTLLRCLNKLQEEGHCKCINISVPGVSNCGRSKIIEVILHPSFQNMSPELLAQIHDKMRSFESQTRQKSYVRSKKGRSVPMLDNVERIPNNLRSEVHSERLEVMIANGFVLPKMVRTRLFHILLWDWMNSSLGWDDALSSSYHSYDRKNPHSTCKLFELEPAVKSMPLALFLQVVGCAQKIERMDEKCRNGLLLSDLPMEEYKSLVDIQATGRLSGLVDRLRRLKLIRLVSKDHAEAGASSEHATLTNALELKPYIEEPATIVASVGLTSPDLRPHVRHDFILSSKKAVDEYWNTLEYCYSAANSRAALLAFPGTAVHEVFQFRSWVSSRAVTADQRIELHKRVAKDDPMKRLSFNECEKIAKDLDLSMGQVLRVRQRLQRRTRFQRGLNAESPDPQLAEGKNLLSSNKRKRSSCGMSSKHVVDAAADGQSSLERVSPIYYDDDDGKIDGPGTLNLNEEDKEPQTSIHKRALSKLNVARKKKFYWTEEADRQLVIEYVKRRVSLGAKFHRVEWASVPNLPSPPGTCRRRMAALNSCRTFRKALMKLCNLLAGRYSKYLEQCQAKILLDHGDSMKMVGDPALGENNLTSPASMSGEWANFDEDIIKAALDDVLSYKRIAKVKAACDTFSNQENSVDDDHEDCDRTKDSGQVSCSQELPAKRFKLSNDEGSVCQHMHNSVAIANAAELFKLIFLNNSKAPEVPTLLAETLRRYSEHDLHAAFNYLREKKIMIGGSSDSPFALSQHFMQSISLSEFPADTGKRAASFFSQLHEREKDLIEEGVDIPSDLQCGDIFTLCALLSSGELSIDSCLPDEGVGETQNNRISKRKTDSVEMDGEELPKLKKTFGGEGEMISRREKGFPGIKLSLHLEAVSRSVGMELFNEAEICPASKRLCIKDRGIPLDVNCGLLDSDVSGYVGEMINSGRTIKHVFDARESPWEAMTRYAELLISSWSCRVESSVFHSDVFKNLYSAIQKSGDNGLSIKDIRKILNVEDEKILEVIIEVLEAFGRALKVNAYDSIHIVDSLYRSKYFLTTVHRRAGNCHKGQKRKFEDVHIPLNLDHIRETVSSSEETHASGDEVHRVTVLNLPEDVSDPTTDMSTKDELCGPLFPWMNGDGTINEPVYKGLIRRVLGILMQHPGILEVDIVNRMHTINPQSCKKLLEIMSMDNHIITRKMHQMTSNQPPSILNSLFGAGFRKSKVISRVHYFANFMRTTLL